MSTTQIADYIGRGTHAARPATPSIPSGATAVYYETDTGSTFVWTGSAWTALGGGGGAAASIVQVATVVGGSLGAVTFGVAPTAGNLLIGIGFDTANAPVNGTGWTQLTGTGTGVSGRDACSIGYKVCGSGESTTQTPSTSSASPVSWVVWEISGGSPGVFTAARDQFLSTLSASIRTFLANQLVLGAFDYETSPGGAPSSVSGIDHYTTVVGGSRSLTYWDVTPASVGNNSPSAVYGSGYYEAYGAIVVGV